MIARCSCRAIGQPTHIRRTSLVCYGGLLRRERTNKVTPGNEGWSIRSGGRFFIKPHWSPSCRQEQWLASLAGIVFPDGRGVVQSFGLRCIPMMPSVGQPSVPSSSVLSSTAYTPSHGRDAVLLCEHHASEFEEPDSDAPNGRHETYFISSQKKTLGQRITAAGKGLRGHHGAHNSRRLHRQDAQ